MVVLNKLIAHSRTTEVNALSIRISGVFDKGKVTEDTHLNKIFADLKTESARLLSAINSNKAESDLDKKDEERDEKIRAIHYIILGFLHHPDKAIKTSAEVVDKVFEKYGLSIINKSYASETTLIESLLEDFKDTELQSSIKALSGMQQMIDALRVAQDEFNQTRIKYEEEKAKQGSKDNATTIKKEVVKIINDQLVVYLRAMVQVNEAKYGDFTNIIATIIDSNNEAVKKRKKKEVEEG